MRCFLQQERKRRERERREREKGLIGLRGKIFQTDKYLLKFYPENVLFRCQGWGRRAEARMQESEAEFQGGDRPAGHVVWNVGAENSLYTRGRRNTVSGPSGPLLVVFNKVLLAHGWACLFRYRLWLLSCYTEGLHSCHRQCAEMQILPVRPCAQKACPSLIWMVV